MTLETNSFGLRVFRLQKGIVYRWPVFTRKPRRQGNDKQSVLPLGLKLMEGALQEESAAVVGTLTDGFIVRFELPSEDATIRQQ